MPEPHPPVRSLILLGGQSSDLRCPCYLLPVPSEVSEAGKQVPLLIHSLFIHHMFQVKYGDPLIRTVTMPVRDDAQRDELKEMLEQHHRYMPIDLGYSYVQEGQEDSGPVRGLLAASRLDKNAHWLVTGCNFPVVNKRAVEELWKQHKENRKAVTCYYDEDDGPVPLVAIWSPIALRRLTQQIEKEGKVRLTPFLDLLKKEQSTDVVDSKEIPDHSKGVHMIKPKEESWIIDVDSNEQWKMVIKHWTIEYGEITSA